MSAEFRWASDEGLRAIQAARDSDPEATERVVLGMMSFLRSKWYELARWLVPLEEWEQEGAIVVLRSLEDFDPKRGNFASHVNQRLWQLQVTIRRRQGRVRTLTELTAASDEDQIEFDRLRYRTLRPTDHDYYCINQCGRPRAAGRRSAHGLCSVCRRNYERAKQKFGIGVCKDHGRVLRSRWRSERSVAYCPVCGIDAEEKRAAWLED